MVDTQDNVFLDLVSRFIIFPFPSAQATHAQRVCSVLKTTGVQEKMPNRILVGINSSRSSHLSLVLGLHFVFFLSVSVSGVEIEVLLLRRTAGFDGRKRDSGETVRWLTVQSDARPESEEKDQERHFNLLILK